MFTLRRVFVSFFAAVAICLLFGSVVTIAYADNGVSDGSQVMQKFSDPDDNADGVLAVPEKEKDRIMFFMGVPLIVLLLITAVLGVAMAVFGKPYFVAHMIFAGLSLTLALAHAVVGVVWFYPF